MENSKKKIWITLKTLCLYLGISVVLFVNLTACKSLPPKPVQACTLTENNALAAARDGNLAVVKDYLENGGDPMLECFALVIGDRPTGPGRQHLYLYVQLSKSLELLTYYLSYKITADAKDDMLLHYLSLEYGEHVNVLVKNGAHLFSITDFCCRSCLKHLKFLSGFNYDFNWIDSEDGNNLLMKYAGCPSEGYEDEMIEILKFLVSQGVETNLKNKNRETAVDMAVNPKIKAYLQGLE